MPSSLYRLAGLPHHAEPQGTTTSEPPAAEAAVIDPVEESIEEVSAASSDSVDTALEETSSNAPDPTSKTVNWDPSWTKSQLLEVAAGLGLTVTTLNTKADIVAALTAATSS